MDNNVITVLKPLPDTLGINLQVDCTVGWHINNKYSSVYYAYMSGLGKNPEHDTNSDDWWYAHLTTDQYHKFLIFAGNYAALKP